MKRQSEEFKRLHAEWCEILEHEPGCAEIETEINGRTYLVEYHSLHFQKKKVQTRKPQNEEYFQQAEKLFYSDDFDRIRLSIIKHGNSCLNQNQVRSIWVLHISGDSERKISGALGINRRSIQRIIGKFREWMKIL